MRPTKTIAAKLSTSMRWRLAASSSVSVTGFTSGASNTSVLPSLDTTRP